MQFWESTDFYLHIIGDAPFGFAHHEIILDEDGNPVDYRFLDANKAFGEFTGLLKEQFLGKTVREVFPGIELDEFNWIGFYGKIALEGGKKEFEQYFSILDKWYKIHAFSNERMYFTTLVIDITESKKQTEELENFFAVNPDMMIIADSDANFVKINDAWSRILGHSLEDLKKKKFLDFIHKDDIEPTLRAMENLAAGEDIRNFVNRYRCKDGSYRYIEWRAHPIGNLIYSAARDITDRMLADIKLREREADFADIFQSVSEGICYSTARGQIISVNDALVRMTGIDASELIGHNVVMLAKKFLSVKNVGPAVKFLIDLIEGREIRPIEIVLNNRIIEITATRNLTSGRLTGVLHDITDRRRAQGAVLESEQKHRSLIEQMQEGLVVDDENGLIQIVNPMFCRMTELEEHELLGKSGYSLLLSEDQILEMGKRDINRKNGISEEYELEISTRSGKRKTLWFHATPVKDPDGQICGSMSTVIDITEKKLLENELERQTRLRELLMEISSGFINIPFTDLDASVQEALKKMALFVHADRSYTFDYDWDADVCNNIHEWCAEGVSPEIDNLQGVPLLMMQDWVEAHKKGEPMYVPDVFALPRGAVREILEPQGIKSVLAVPMMNDGRCIGFVGFDSVKRHHNYSQAELQLLKVFAQSLANVRMRREMISEILASKENAEVNERHFRSIFHQTPILFWLEDFTDAIRYIGKLKQEGVRDFQDFFESRQDEVIKCAGMAHIVDVNEAVLKTLKYSDKKSLIDHFPETLTPVSFNAFRQALISLANDEQYFECITEHKTMSGEVRQFYLKSFISPDYTDYSRVIVAMTDITELKAKEQELIASKERAEQSDSLKTAFLQNLSHEIRTPLNGIIGFSDLLRDPDISAEDRSYYTEIIIERGWQLTSIINDILTISSLETRQEQLYKEVFNLNTLLRNQIAVFSGQAAEKGVELKLTTYLEESRAELLADKTKLGQVLNNLFTNAVKFTSSGRIELSCRLQDNELKFCLQDTGTGIEKSKQSIIFDRFVQADDTIRRTYGGTGLGLSICKGFVELMGGSIWVESEPGHGSVFCFTMPYFPAIKHPEIPSQAEKPSTPSKKMTILVAEDEEYNFIYIEALLSKLDVNILRAYTGKQALDICKADSIDLVLMDIKMPEMNGYEATMKIREFHPHLPIIAQTAYAEKSEVVRYGNIFNDYITKPFSAEKLLAVIQIFMNQ